MLSRMVRGVHYHMVPSFLRMHYQVVSHIVENIKVKSICKIKKKLNNPKMSNHFHPVDNVKSQIFSEICNHISVDIKIVVYLPIYDIEYWSIYEIFQKSFFDRYMSEFIIFWPIYENFYFAQIGYFRLLHPSRIEKKFIYRSI